MAKKVTNFKINEKKVKRGNLELKLGASAGALAGYHVAGYINTVLPNIIQTYGGAIIGASSLGWGEKTAALTTLASAPVDWVAPVIITGLGAGLGALAGKGIKMIKNGVPKKSSNKLATGKAR